MKNRILLLTGFLCVALLPTSGINAQESADGHSPRPQKGKSMPVITEGDIVSITMSEDGTPTAFALTLNATDSDMHALSWTVASSASNGTAAVVGTDTSATVSYAPNANFNGSDSFGVQASDGNGGTDLILVNVTVEPVNDAPALAAIGNQTVGEGENLLFAVGATDPDGETAVLSATNLPAGAAFDADLGVFTWTPGFEEAGTYSDIVFTAVDGGDASVMDTETIAITVTDTNRPPLLDAVGNVEVREENTLTLTLSGTDPDNDAILFFMNMLPSGATFDAMTATLTYTPALGDAGDYAVVAGVQDDGTPQQSDTEAFVITVTPLDPSAVFEADAEALLANFATGDTDADGLLSLAEAQVLIPELLESRFDGMDGNSDGYLSEAELLPFATISDNALENAAQSLLNAFSSADADEDGLLSSDEANAVLQNLSVDQFNAMDLDESGTLSEAEISEVATARAVNLEGLAETLIDAFAGSDADMDDALSRAEAEAVDSELSFEQFVGLDLNGDGGLSENELTTSATVGDADLEAAAELIMEFFFDADMDGDGFVNREEAQRGISTLTLRDFQELDLDDDGLLSRVEVDTAAAVGDAELETAAETLVDGFADGDGDDDGSLSQTEARTILPSLTLEQFQMIDSDGDDLLSETEVNAAALLDDPVPLAPVIVEGVTVGALTQSAALLSWKTQVSSTAILRYGTSQSSLDLSVPSDTASNTHQVLLSDLTANTTYFFRVDSVYPGDDTLTGTSPVASFVTAASPDTTAPNFVALPAVTGLSDTSIHLTWRTDETTFGIILLTDDTGNTTVETPQAAEQHSLTLDNLTPTTAYDVLITARDGSGNLSSVTLAITTQAEPDRAPARIVEGVLLTRLTDTSIGLRWATDKPATTEVAFSEDGGTEVMHSLPGLRREHLITLVGLRPETTYAIEARSTDWLDNGTARVTLPSTATHATSTDNVPVFMAAPRSLGQTDTTATIYWETDQPADSTVYFWQTDGVVMAVSSETQVLAHQIRLTGLQAGTTYRFSCTSTTLTGMTTSTDSTAEPGGGIGTALVFTTEDTPDEVPPTIVDGPEVVGITDEGFTIRWTTDELTDTYVRYGLVDAIERQEFQSNILRTEHLVTVRGLRSEAAYEIAVTSADSSGNGPASALPLTTTTTAAVDSTPPTFTVAPVADTVFSKFAVLRWETDEFSSADVTLNRTPNEVESVQALPALGTSQSLVLTNLLPGTTYGYTVRAVDQNQNVTSATGQFTTASAELTVSPARLIIPVGDTVQLNVSSEDPEETSFQFLSDNPAIASVNSDGIVTAVAAGQVNVFAADLLGTRILTIPVTVYVLPEPEDLTGFFALLGIFLLQDGQSGIAGPCFIATAAAGTPLAPEIDVLRQFRDRWLLTNAPGSMVVDTYYQLSPPLADWIATHPLASALARMALLPVVVLMALWLKSPLLVTFAGLLLILGIYRRSSSQCRARMR